MNNSAQAKNGFKTFIATLVLSLGTFAVLYYVTTDSQRTAEPVNVKTPQKVLGKSTTTDERKAQSNVFKDLSKKRIDTPAKVVLAGADEQTQSTESAPVPETGTIQITAGFIASLVILTIGLYVIKADPRKKALRSFENSITKES